MKKRALLLIFLLSSFLLYAQEYEYNYSFFSNSGMPDDYFYSQADNESGSFLLNRKFRLLVNNQKFHTPGNSLELSFINSKSGDWRATVYHAPIRGVDQFKPANYFSCWIYKSMPDTAKYSLPAIRFMYSDSSLSEKILLPDTKGNAWEQVTVPTAGIKGFSASNPSAVIAVVFCQPFKENGKYRTIYVDDM